MIFFAGKKYTLCSGSARRASSFVPNPRATAEVDVGQDEGTSGTRSTLSLGRLSNMTQIQYPSPAPQPIPPEVNRRSLSLTNLSMEPIASPPPLPPRRRVPPPPQRAPFLIRTTEGPADHLQLPPDSVIPVLERNAVVRSSRLMMNHPFVYFRFEAGAPNSGSGSGMNVVPLWIDNDDQPPSYAEAIKLKPPNTENPETTETLIPVEIDPVEPQNQNVESSREVQEGERIVEPAEKPKEIRPFRKETSV